ncbi:GmrSD restriction endonuclease domain-containing protein [Flavobacterium sp. TMP13]|uniref:GmrSD restriction endonuclease domain-containing protein n=1 Tax=Flavobacterium sp. TMP13 TaxID=3425950 RepID=UPI003D7854D2
MIQKYTFFKLINQFIIEIPIIQRDYAQGRELPNVTYIREKFITDLVQTVSKNEDMHLGFVYGKLEGKDKSRNMQLHKEAVEKLLYTVEQYANQFQINVNSTIDSQNIEKSHTLRFIPLDGQQRLTTLFLLYWYINLRKTNANSMWLTNFKYNNRKAALAFFEELGKEENITLINSNLESNLKKQLQNYTWYLNKWDYDATVSGALVMLQQIHNEFKKYDNINFDDINLEELSFTFDFLDLDALNQSDELYIKMNERGKQLTDFEHFKAWLQDYTNKKYTNDNDKVFLNNFWKQLDTEWLEFFWKNIDVDYTGLDDFYFNYLKTIAINYHLATNSEKEIPEYLKSLLQDVRNTDSYDKEKVKYIPLSRFVQKIKKENTEEETIFELFSIDSLKHISKSFQFLINVSKDNELVNDINKTIKAPFISNTILEAYVKKKSFTLNLWDQTMYFSILKYFENTSISNSIHFENWTKVIRNLIYNTYIQSPENLYNALHSINDLFNNHYSDTNLLSEILISDSFQLKFFSENQLKEEKIKATLLDSEEWQNNIERFENHNYFNGQIGFILKLSFDESQSYNLDLFKNKGLILESLFEKETPDFLLQRALLTKGDYLVQIGSNHTFCKTETDSLRSRNENWRRVFNDDKRLKLLNELVIDVLNRDNDDIYESLKGIIISHTYDSNQWQFYFLESPYPLQNSKILEIRWNDNEDIRLLQSKTVIGYHLELRSIYLLKMINSKVDSIFPFEKIQFLWDKTSSGHPGISITGFIYKNKKYQLDIRYSFENNLYNFCIYHKADILKERKMDSIVLDCLLNYDFDDKFNYYSKSVHFDSIVEELNMLMQNLKKTAL